MDATTLKSKISQDNILHVLQQLGAEPVEKAEHYECLTVCHNGDSHKLYFYKGTMRFQCFTNCGNMDIIDFVQHVKTCSVFDAIQFLIKALDIRDDGMDVVVGEFVDLNSNRNFDLDVSDIHINKYDFKDLPEVDENILKRYYHFYYQGWLDEGITIDTMKKYHIAMSIEKQQIIIPHYDYRNKLVGVRARNLDKEEVDRGRKYIPVFENGKSYKYPTGMNMYGLNMNMNAINKYHKVILFEAEKSVLKMDSIYGEDSIGVALNGSSLTQHHIELLKKLDISEVIIAFDKEFSEVPSKESKFYAKKIAHTFGRLSALYQVSVLWDTDGDTEQKDSPIDRGREVFEKLLKNRITIF